MIARQLAAATLALALLNVNVARADAACGEHGVAEAAPAPAPVMDHHAHHQGTSPASADPEQCDAPRTRDCCSALASCAITFEAGIRELDVTLVVPARPIAPPAMSAPLETRTGPEPPPPRA